MRNFLTYCEFKNYNYIGDPCNTVKIFNELEVGILADLIITPLSKQLFTILILFKVILL